jgi:hypothetical protein
MIYKVSYVIVRGSHPGAIINQDQPPEIGAQVRLNGDRFEIIEVIELLPSRNNFAYVHATCQPVEEAT